MNSTTTMTGNSVSQATGPKKFKILVVEDEADAREIFKALIQSNPNYHVAGAADGKEALKTLEAEKDFDLVLLDIIMPFMDGIEALKHIKDNPAKYGKPKVVMLTNIGGELAVEQSKEFGADDYILKIEAEPETLLRKVDSILLGSVPVHSS